MKCPKCGYPLPDDSEFCQYCGIHLELRSSSDIPLEEVISSKESVRPIEPVIRVPVFESTSEVATNEKSEIITDPIVSSDGPVNTGSTIVVPAVEQSKHTNNNVQQTFCKKCGSVVDPTTKKCSSCGKQYFRASTTLPLVVLSMVLVLSIGLNVMQYIQGREAIETVTSQTTKIEELEEKVTSLNTTVSTQKNTIFLQQNTIASLEGKAEYFDIICKELSFGNIGYAASNFKSSESIIVIDKNETNRKFTLTAHWTNGGSVSIDHSNFAAKVSFDNDSWTTSTKMTVKPLREGVTVVTFSNDVDSKTFKILIIVTD